jgi:hypothetical protein
MELTELERRAVEVLEPGERYVAAAQVRVGGARSTHWEVLLVVAVVCALLIVLRDGLLVRRTAALVILVLALAVLGYFGAGVASRLLNRRAEALGRSGGPASIAARFPGRPGGGMWLLVLSDNRLSLWYPALTSTRRLYWNLPASELVRAEAAGRRRLPADAIRLCFRDGSSVRLPTVGGGRFLRRLAARPPSEVTLYRRD